MFYSRYVIDQKELVCRYLPVQKKDFSTIYRRINLASPLSASHRSSPQSDFKIIFGERFPRQVENQRLHFENVQNEDKKRSFCGNSRNPQATQSTDQEFCGRKASDFFLYQRHFGIIQIRNAEYR